MTNHSFPTLQSIDFPGSVTLKDAEAVFDAIEELQPGTYRVTSADSTRVADLIVRRHDSLVTLVANEPGTRSRIIHTAELHQPSWSELRRGLRVQDEAAQFIPEHALRIAMRWVTETAWDGAPYTLTPGGDEYSYDADVCRERYQDYVSNRKCTPDEVLDFSPLGTLAELLCGALSSGCTVTEILVEDESYAPTPAVWDAAHELDRNAPTLRTMEHRMLAAGLAESLGQKVLEMFTGERDELRTIVKGFIDEYAVSESNAASAENVRKTVAARAFESARQRREF